MKDDCHRHVTEPRSVTIARFASEYRLSTGTKMATYADGVRQVYHRRVPDPVRRTVRFHVGGEPSADLEANAQIVRRILDDDVRMPVDLEEALVLALPEPFQTRCVRALCERYDLLAVRLPDTSAGGAAKDLAQLMRETADVIEKLGPIVADGVVDERDRPHAAAAVREIDEAIAELLAWRYRLTHLVKPHSEDDRHV